MSSAPTGSRDEFQPSSHRPADRWRIGLLILLATLPYLNTLWNGFVYDDDIQILKNPYIRDFSYLKDIFTTSVWSYLGGSKGITDYYRPVMTLGYLFCRIVFGYKPYGYHLVSLGLNVAVVVLLFGVTRRLFRNRSLAFLAAALFALHPIHTEAVDWIAAATDLELALFFLLAFWFFLRLGDAENKHAGLLWLGMAGSYILALLSKEPAATLPLLATVYEHACREDRHRTSRAVKMRRYAPLWLLTVGYILIRLRLVGGFAPVRIRAQMPADAVFFSAVALVGHYLWKLIWPVHLCAYYPFPAEISVLLPRILEGSVAMILCVALAIYLWRAERRLFFALVWFFVTLAPVLNPRWMPANVFAERYAYLPSVGLCWLVAWLGLHLWQGASNRGLVPRRALAAGACALGALLILRIVTRNPDWKDDLTFYTRTLAAIPKSGDMHNNLGTYYWDHGNPEGAGREWEKALQLEPNAPFILDNMGLLRIRQKRYPEAVGFFERSLQRSARDEEAHAGLGNAYRKMGETGKAELELREAVALAPLDVRARVLLGELYFDEGKYGLAKDQFQASLQPLPSLRGYLDLGLDAWVQKDFQSARADFNAAQRLDPSSSKPYFMLGLLDGSSGNTEEAIREYEAGLRIDPTNPTALAALAKLKSQPTTPRHSPP